MGLPKKDGCRTLIMQLQIIKNEFAICQLEDCSGIDYSDPFFFIGKTDAEISLVCSLECIPVNAKKCDRTWKAFRIQGVLDFSLIGILSKIATLLAENNIGIFVVSTYNTDYVLTKAECFEQALAVLRNAGYVIAE